jgi:tetratricopeptide (TPR) repeat protein
MTTLHAIYDLQIGPASFDFVTFVILAHLGAQQAGCAHVHFVLVPGPTDGFRPDDSTYDLASKYQRLYNIILPACAMVDLPVSISLCAHRPEAARLIAGLDGPLFPDGYSISNPTASFLCSTLVAAHYSGEKIPSLRAATYARRNAAKWLSHHCNGLRPIVITLREAGHSPGRNSNLSAWIEFARRLDHNKYLPIFVRDTEKAVERHCGEFDGLTTCPIASFDLAFRHALYELAYLNLTVPNGPGVLCWLNDRIRFIMFGMLNQSAPETSATYLASMGLKIGGQLPFVGPFQRLVWERDTLEVIEREFAAMEERIGDTPTGTVLPLEPANAEPPIKVAVRLQTTGRLEEATAIYQDIVTREPNNAEAWHLLSIIAQRAGRPDVAEKMIRRAISLRPAQASYYVNLAAVLRNGDRTDEAVNCLWRAVALAPENAGAHADLAELLQAEGANAEAKAALLEAIRLAPESPVLCERAARVLHALGHASEAADLYRRALDLRDARIEAAHRMRAHMPEIPVLTQKTS